MNVCKKRQLERKTIKDDDWYISFLALQTWASLRLKCRGFFQYCCCVNVYADMVNLSVLFMQFPCLTQIQVQVSLRHDFLLPIKWEQTLPYHTVTLLGVHNFSKPSRLWKTTVRIRVTMLEHWIPAKQLLAWGSRSNFIHIERKNYCTKLWFTTQMK